VILFLLKGYLLNYLLQYKSATQRMLHSKLKAW